MARIAGVDLPKNKHAFIGLQYIYGIGQTRCIEILEKADVPVNKRVSELSDEEIARLRQIIQNEYLGVQPKILHTKFTGNLLVAYVLDMGAMNRYVTTEDAAGWGKSQKELHDISVENLESISKGMSMQALGNDIVAIAINDSYDAARVILPRIQKKMIELLGAEFRVGIPNRDFLIFWSKRLDNEGVKKLEKQISEDFKSMPYPLSNKVLFFKEERFSELTK